MALSRDDRLTDKTRIARVLRFGRRFSTPEFRILVMRSPDSRSHLVIVVPKSVDKRSTVRNALRRRISEIMRPILSRLTPPADIAVIVSRGARELDSAD